MFLGGSGAVVVVVGGGSFGRGVYGVIPQENVMLFSDNFRILSLQCCLNKNHITLKHYQERSETNMLTALSRMP